MSDFFGVKGNFNIVLVVMDTVRAKNLPMYGYQKNTMPFLSKLIANSFIYTNAYSNSSWTLPSHASLFTGKLPSETGMIYEENCKLSLPTIAEKMKERGYFTIGISCNPFISSVYKMDKGFDKFFYIDRYIVNPKSGKKLSKLLSFSKGGFSNFIKLILSSVPFFRNFFFVDKGASKVNKIIGEELKSIHSPFFMFINYMEAHEPYGAPRSIEKKFLKKKRKYSNYSLSRLIGMDGVDIEEMNAVYDAGLFYLDSKLEEMYKVFAKEGLLDKTVFIFTSDHGELIGEHGLFDHGLGLFPELVRIPLIIKFPNNKRKRVDEEISLIGVHHLILSNFKYSTDRVIQEYTGFPNKEILKKVSSTASLKGIDQIWVGLVEKGKQYILKEDGSFYCLDIKKEKLIKTKVNKKLLFKMLSDVKIRVNKVSLRRKLLVKIKKFKEGV